MRIASQKAVGKARRSHAFRRRQDPLLKGLRPGGKILPNGNVQLTQIDGSTVAYQVVPVLGWRVDPVVNQTAAIRKVVRAVKASVAEALAVAGLPADTQIDFLPSVNTVFLALDGKKDGALIKRMADEAAYLAVERISDANTAQIAAE
jgi:hypothetical protein